MNEYITLDGKKYTMLKWDPEIERAMTHRLNLDGSGDVTWGPGNICSWKGQLVTTNDEDEQEQDFGSPDDLRASYMFRGVLEFTDEVGDSHRVVMTERLHQRSLSPVWDDPKNKIIFNVTLLKVG